MTGHRVIRARRRALYWSAGYAAAVVAVTSLLPLWVFCHPHPEEVGIWLCDPICFWKAVGHAARDHDWRYLWTGSNRAPTAVLLALAVGTWPIVYGWAVWCRRPDLGQERDDYAEPGSKAHKPFPAWEASLLGLSAVALVLAVVLLIELVHRLDHWICHP